MPQNETRAPWEVCKAKAAAVQGTAEQPAFRSAGVFVGYNRDSQWSKYIIMDLIAECAEAPAIIASVLSTLTIDHKKALALCQKGFITATDLDGSLAHDFSLPLRQAKMVIERAVKYSKDRMRNSILGRIDAGAENNWRLTRLFLLIL
jgi:argininosuccinate lyase